MPLICLMLAGLILSLPPTCSYALSAFAVGTSDEGVGGGASYGATAD